MCGICGVIGTQGFGIRESGVFDHLLYVSSLRGEDSTGLFTVEYNNHNLEETFVKKRRHATDSPSLLKFLHKETDKNAVDGKRLFSDWYKKRAIVGHCRAATIGNVTVQNTHPFEHGDIIGVHNGTIRGLFPHKDDFETDSEALIKTISELGIEEALNKFQTYDTAYALVYYDKSEETMNFVRNGKRPLYFTFYESLKFMMFASESDFLRFAVRRCNLPGISGYTKEGGDYFQMKEHYLMSVKMKDIKEFSLEDDAFSVKQLKIKPYTYTYTHSKNTPWDGYDDYYDLDTHSWRKKDKKDKKNHSVFNKVTDKRSQVSPVTSGQLVRGFNGTYISFEAFSRFLKDGCCVCSSPADPKEKNIEFKISWWNHENWACEKCSKTDLFKAESILQ